MKPFDIFSWEPPGWNEPHPVVIISHPDRADRKNTVEVVACATARATRGPRPHEILLDQADGLDWPTLCYCDLIYAVPRDDIKNARGHVSDDRQRNLIRTIISAHAWPEVF